MVFMRAEKVTAQEVGRLRDVETTQSGRILGELVLECSDSKHNRIGRFEMTLV